MKRYLFLVLLFLLVLTAGAQAKKNLKIIYLDNGVTIHNTFSLDSLPEWGYKSGNVFLKINGRLQLQIPLANFIQIEFPDTVKGVPARSAYDFYNSMGVCTHIGYGSTTYSNFNLLSSLVVELGVKHIRDGFGGNVTITEQERRYKALGEKGIKFLFCTGTRDLAWLMPYVNRLLPYLSGVEGSNEVDYSYNKDITQWLPISVNRQQLLYDSIKNNTLTKSLPIINFSLADLGNTAQSVGDQSNKIDYGNLHIYAAARHPANFWGSGLTEMQALTYARLVSATKPIIISECGYHNYVAYPQNHAGTPESVAAVYFPHLFFEYFNCGITRSYIYELFDQTVDTEGGNKELHFGLVRYDGTPKPGFYAVKNLISLIADNNNTIPQPLDFKLQTLTQATNSNLRYTLLQKSNGSWWLAVYRAEEIFNYRTLVTTSLQPEKINLLLDRNFSEVNIYMPNKSIDKQQVFTNKSSIDFDLGEQLVLIEIIP